MAKSSIEWTDKTWNPVTGCTRVSSGCDSCYAAAYAARKQAIDLGFELLEKMLDLFQKEPDQEEQILCRINALPSDQKELACR